MTKRLLLFLVTVGLAVASAKSYRVTLYEPSVLGGSDLKAGDYKLDVDGNKMILRSGRQSFEADVKVEQGDQRFSATSVRYTNGDGKYHIQEIRLGGTNVTLVVSQ